MKHQGLGRKARKKRSWFRRIIGKISSFVPGTVGLALKAALAINDAIFPLNSKLLNQSQLELINQSQFEPNPTQAEEDQAEIILKTKALPAINLIESNITSLGIKPIDIIISELNVYLKQIATLQAWVEMNYQNPQLNVVNYMVASIIEPLLAALNKLITQVLKTNNISTKVTSTSTSFVASDFQNVLQFELNWQKSTSTTYQKLSKKVVNTNDIEEVVIIPSIDNTDLSNIITDLPVNTDIPQKNNGFGKVLFGVGLFFVFLKIFKKDDQTKNKE